MTPQEEIDRLIEQIISRRMLDLGNVYFNRTETFVVPMVEMVEELKAAIKSQLSTALSEALALRVEVERFREALDYIAVDDCDQARNCFKNWEIARTMPQDDPISGFSPADFCNQCYAKYQLSQPTPTGLTDKLLRLVVAAIKRHKFKPGFDVFGLEVPLDEACEALTPDEVKIIEGLK